MRASTPEPAFLTERVGQDYVLGKHTQRCCAQESPCPSTTCCRRRLDLYVLDEATVLSVVPPSPNPYRRVSCWEEEESPGSDRQDPGEISSNADHESDEPPEDGEPFHATAPTRKFGVNRPVRCASPSVVRHSGDGDGLYALVQRDAERFDELSQPSAAETVVRPQVQGADVLGLGKPSRKGHVQDAPPPIVLENQNTPTVGRAVLGDLPHVLGRKEDGALNAIGTNGIPPLLTSGITYDQVRTVGVHPSPAYDVRTVRRHASWAYHRLVRLPQHTTSFNLPRHHSPLEHGSPRSPVTHRRDVFDPRGRPGSVVQSLHPYLSTESSSDLPVVESIGG